MKIYIRLKVGINRGKKMKITDKAKAKELFKKGKISKTSYWRFKKRGWVIVNYHTPKNTGNCLNDKEKVELYSYIFYVTLKYMNMYLKNDFFGNFKDIANDIANEVYIMILERGFDFDKAKASSKNMIKQTAQRNKLYNNKFIFADNKKHKGNRMYFESIEALQSTGEISI